MSQIKFIYLTLCALLYVYNPIAIYHMFFFPYKVTKIKKKKKGTNTVYCKCPRE